MKEPKQEAALPFQIYRIDQVEDATGLSRAFIYREARRGNFPKPISISAHLKGWLQSDLEAWLQTRLDATKKAG